MSKSKRISCLVPTLGIFLILILFIILTSLYLPELAVQTFGPATPSLNNWQSFRYSIHMLWYSDGLLGSGPTGQPDQVFIIAQGESVDSIANKLQQAGLIQDAKTFQVFLIWKGFDRTVQAGTYNLNPQLTGIQVADALQNPDPSDATLIVLPGWRMEEIALALNTSGLGISAADFIAAATAPYYRPGQMPENASAEGFLFPGEYDLPRTTTPQQLVSVLISAFEANLTSDLMLGFERNGLDVYDAIILASMIEREAVVDEEMPIIASVFYNRLAVNMKLESDPTVQYALGFNSTQDTWWTNPLSLFDLRFESPYNTYQYYGLPPAPISNPGSAAIHAVAYPGQTPYYFFMARCDRSGFHNFSETFAEHSENICP